MTNWIANHYRGSSSGGKQRDELVPTYYNLRPQYVLDNEIVLMDYTCSNILLEVSHYGNLE